MNILRPPENVYRKMGKTHTQKVIALCFSQLHRNHKWRDQKIKVIVMFSYRYHPNYIIFRTNLKIAWLLTSSKKVKKKIRRLDRIESHCFTPCDPYFENHWFRVTKYQKLQEVWCLIKHHTFRITNLIKEQVIFYQMLNMLISKQWFCFTYQVMMICGKKPQLVN